MGTSDTAPDHANVGTGALLLGLVHVRATLAKVELGVLLLGRARSKDSEDSRETESNRTHMEQHAASERVNRFDSCWHVHGQRRGHLSGNALDLHDGLVLVLVREGALVAHEHTLLVQPHRRALGLAGSFLRGSLSHGESERGRRSSATGFVVKTKCPNLFTFSFSVQKN